MRQVLSAAVIRISIESLKNLGEDQITHEDATGPQQAIQFVRLYALSRLKNTPHTDVPTNIIGEGLAIASHGVEIACPLQLTARSRSEVMGCRAPAITPAVVSVIGVHSQLRTVEAVGRPRLSAFP